MANNANINKVIYGNDTLIDLTGDTATQADVLSGATFHDASGTLRTGTLDISTKADLVDLAPAFSESTAYTQNQYVTYNGDLYRFIENHPAGSWNAGHVEQVTVGRDLYTALTYKANKPNNPQFPNFLYTDLLGDVADSGVSTEDVAMRTMIAPVFSSSTAYSQGDYVTHSVYLGGTSKLYRFVIDHPAGAWNNNHVQEVNITDITVKKSNTAGLLKNDGTVDTNTYLTSVTRGTTSVVGGYTYDNNDFYISNQTNHTLSLVFGNLEHGSTHPASAGDVYDALADKVSWEDNTFLGAKNLIPFPFSQGSLTQNGVTFTVNADGTVSTSGTCNNSNGSSLYLWQNEIPAWMDSNVDYVLTGCPSGGSTSTYTIQYSNWTEGTSAVYYDEGSGVDIRKITDSTTQRLRIWIRNGVNADGLVFKPMIRLKSDTDNTYAKYSKTNVALTKDKVEWSANLLTGVHNIDASQYFEGTSNDVTWSYIDGVFDANGTATANSQKGTPFIAPYSAQVIVSGCNSGNANIHIYPFDVTDNNRPYRDSTKNSRLTTSDNVYNGNEISFYMEQGHEYQITCRVVKDNTANHVKFYPLLRLASDPDTTYTPYAMTNAELTKKIIFVATYGSTTYTEIDKAFNDGKYIVVNRLMNDGSYLTYGLNVKNTSNTYYFRSFGATTTTNYYCYITSSGTWAVGSNALAPLSSPALTGTPTAPTATAGTNTTQIATTAFVQDAVGTWTTPVSCAIGDTSVTISNAAITTTSNVKVWSETSSGKPLNYSTIVVTTGQAVITFAKALTEVTSVKLQIVK